MAAALGEVGAGSSVGYCACLRRELSGEPDAGNLHLRFDEGRVGRAIVVALSPTLPEGAFRGGGIFNRRRRRGLSAGLTISPRPAALSPTDLNALASDCSDTRQNPPAHKYLVRNYRKEVLMWLTREQHERLIAAIVAIIQSGR